MLDEFAVKTSIFTPLFERFVQNWRQPRRYLITLRGGESRLGIPLAHTYMRPEDPDTFLLRWQGTFVAIPFSEIDRVEEIRGDAPLWTLAQSGGGLRIRPKFGSARGRVLMAPDFDEPLDDFADYMP
ncbi:MAG: DUF2281 domain-containing protein [Polyangia bacterium]